MLIANVPMQPYYGIHLMIVRLARQLPTDCRHHPAQRPCQRVHMDSPSVVDDRKLDSNAIKLNVDKYSTCWSFNSMFRSVTDRPRAGLRTADHGAKGDLRAITGDLSYAPSI